MPDPGTLAPLPSCEVMSKGFGWKLTPASALSRWGGGRMSRPVRRVLSPRAVTHARVAAIHLRRTLPHASSGLPGSSGEQPSNASCLALLPVGFASPHRSPGALVVSCTTVSPLPRPRRGVAVCFLWHCPAGHPGWVLPTTVLYGARTFLGEVSLDATAWPTYPRVKGSAARWAGRPPRFDRSEVRRHAHDGDLPRAVHPRLHDAHRRRGDPHRRLGRRRCTQRDPDRGPDRHGVAHDDDGPVRSPGQQAGQARADPPADVLDRLTARHREARVGVPAPELPGPAVLDLGGGQALPLPEVPLGERGVGLDRQPQPSPDGRRGLLRADP